MPSHLRSAPAAKRRWCAKARSTDYGGIESARADVRDKWKQWRQLEAAVQSHTTEVESANREAEWMRHAVEKLGRLAPQIGEETTLAERRATMMQAEKVADD